MTGGVTLRDGRHPVHLRLASTLATGGGAAGAAAVLIWLVDVGQEPGSLRDGALIGLGAGVTLALLAVLGYVPAPTLLGQGATAVGAVLTAVFGVQAVATEPNGLSTGAALLAVGIGWLALAEAGWWRERLGSRVIGLLLAVGGAQAAVAGPDDRWVGYLLTLLVAVACFATYAAARAWPYLAAGVAGLTVVVPEAVLDWTDGSSVGTGAALLAAGATLLGASVAGLRLRTSRR
jgi:hypothetical protein